MLQSQLLEITAKSLPHGLNENFTISPTIQDEVTLSGLKPTEERGVGQEEVKGREPWSNGGEKALVKSLFLKHNATISFSPKNFSSENLSNWKQMLWMRPHENKKHSCCFPIHHQKRAGSDEERKRMSKQRQKSESASTSQQADEYSKTDA